MESSEALAICIGKHVKEVAKRLVRSVPLIYRWTQATHDYSESGALNPLDRIEAIVSESLSQGSDRGDALLPIRWLASRFNLVVIDVPVTGDCESDAVRAMLDTVKEFGELAAASSEAMADGSISRTDRRSILKEGREVQESLARYLAVVEAECPMRHKAE